MRALVISGGASKITFGIGIASELLKQKTYNLYVGISAGSIICVFAAVGKLKELFEAVLKLNLKQIFNIPPVSKSGQPTWFGIFRLIFNKSSLGKNRRFGSLLRSLFTESDHKQLQNSSADICIGATNYNLFRLEYASKNQVYNDLMEWVCASSNIPLVTEPIKISGSWYFDGGVSNYVGIRKAIEMGATEIDVILHSPLERQISNEDMGWEPDSIIRVGRRTLEIMNHMTSVDDILLGRTLSEAKNVKINFYAPPSALAGPPYSFDKDKLQEWYDQGVLIANSLNTDQSACQKSINT